MSETEQRLVELPAFLTAPATAKVLAALPGSRAVGGAVRDALAGLPVADVDIAAPLPPEELIARLSAAGCKVFETGLAHGTVTAVWEHQPIEVTALRRDVLTDGRHAEVAWTTDWQEDAARRDFTINAMSLGADGVLHDYFGGREDLARGVVRFVGDPETRLAEDYLRLLRFFRFQARYGKGAPDAAALQAICAAIPGLERLSVERIWMEIKRILMVAEPVPALRMMAELGVLPAILSEIAAPDIECVARLVALGAPTEPLLRLAALGGAAPGLAARLKFSIAETRALRFLQEAEAPDAAVDAAEFRRWRARHAAVAVQNQRVCGVIPGQVGQHLGQAREHPAVAARPEVLAAVGCPVLRVDVLGIAVVQAGFLVEHQLVGPDEVQVQLVEVALVAGRLVQLGHGRHHHVQAVGPPPVIDVRRAHLMLEHLDRTGDLAAVLGRIEPIQVGVGLKADLLSGSSRYRSA